MIKFFSFKNAVKSFFKAKETKRHRFSRKALTQRLLLSSRKKLKRQKNKRGMRQGTVEKNEQIHYSRYEFDKYHVVTYGWVQLTLAFN